ncbi:MULTISPECIES: GlxA family transcriptional regulator [Galbibacter]|uniref:Helix-turn-helix domain-containing protein n=1 Tax=Galbibacter pacificus TaxID=2996052 RepID=A0ABT6FS72_9FLAO|nr:helix-turn-helix domain-containing protein [Galbibacter pacificus]MDG3582756.1 helix-turn-helix domain-containing protein [Galbibacter pacificus]MDG3586125.1 helix-turn-helix domain-containing protein [Galbibacter pacificus]
MKHISILIPEGDTSLSNLEATHKMFSMTNNALQKMGEPPLFKIQLVGATKKSSHSYGIFSIHPDITIDQLNKTDLIIIPAIHGDYRKIVEANSLFVPWIIKQHRNGAEVASLCIGAFLLAKTGLLNGKDCTTHWLAAEDFKKMYPEVNLVDDKIITDEQGIYTSGGAYSSLNLNLYLIEKMAGREMAVLSSKIFEIDIDRDSQSPFIIFKGQKDHEDSCVKKTQEYIEQNYHEKITVSKLTKISGIGRRSFERRFKKTTSNTIIEYLQRVRVEAAKKKLEKGIKTVNEVMYDVGYSDNKSFRDIFKRTVGMTPVEYKNRYRKEPVL